MHLFSIDPFMLYAQCWELHHAKNAVALYIRYVTCCVCYENSIGIYMDYSMDLIIHK